MFLLNDGSRKVEFRQFGWAHTKGDGFVYLPKEQVLCTGDAVVNGPYNATMDAHIGNWPTVLAAAGKLKIKTILPGHGPSGGRDLLTGQAQFMTELYKAVKAGVDQGKTLADIQSSIQLPETVANWVSDASLKTQVADAYPRSGREIGDRGPGAGGRGSDNESVSSHGYASGQVALLKPRRAPPRPLAPGPRPL